MLDLEDAKELVINALDELGTIDCPDCGRASANWRKFLTPADVEDWLRKQPNVADSCAEANAMDKG